MYQSETVSLITAKLAGMLKLAFLNIFFTLPCLAQVFIPFAFWNEQGVTITAIPNTDGPQYVSVSQGIIVANKGAALSCTGTYLSATTSNSTVLSLGNITFSGIYPNCSISFLTTVATGTSNVSIIFTNEHGYSATRSFVFTAYAKPIMAFSFRKIVRDYVGSALRVRRVSDDVETDLGFDGGGNFDLASYNAFKGASSVTIAIWYDQSGNAYHATQPTKALQPTVTIGGFNGAPQGEFAGSYWLITTQAQNVLLVNRDLTVFFASKATTVSQNNYGSWNPGNSSDRVSIHVNWSDNNIYWDAPGLCCSNSRVSATNAAYVGVPKVYVFSRSAGSQFIKINGLTVASRTDASGTYGSPATPWYIGTTGAYGSGTAPLAEYVQYLQGLTPAQVDAITNEQKNYFGL